MTLLLGIVTYESLLIRLLPTQAICNQNKEVAVSLLIFELISLQDERVLELLYVYFSFTNLPV